MSKSVLHIPEEIKENGWAYKWVQDERLPKELDRSWFRPVAPGPVFDFYKSKSSNTSRITIDGFTLLECPIQAVDG